jgi:hypothetical protein
MQGSVIRLQAPETDELHRCFSHGLAPRTQLSVRAQPGAWPCVVRSPVEARCVGLPWLWRCRSMQKNCVRHGQRCRDAGDGAPAGSAQQRGRVPAKAARPAVLAAHRPAGWGPPCTHVSDHGRLHCPEGHRRGSTTPARPPCPCRACPARPLGPAADGRCGSRAGSLPSMLSRGHISAIVVMPSRLLQLEQPLQLAQPRNNGQPEAGALLRSAPRAAAARQYGR